MSAVPGSIHQFRGPAAPVTSGAPRHGDRAGGRRACRDCPATPSLLGVDCEYAMGPCSRLVYESSPGSRCDAARRRRAKYPDNPPSNQGWIRRRTGRGRAARPARKLAAHHRPHRWFLGAASTDARRHCGRVAGEPTGQPVCRRIAGRRRAARSDRWPTNHLHRTAPGSARHLPAACAIRYIAICDAERRIVPNDAGRWRTRESADYRPAIGSTRAARS